MLSPEDDALLRNCRDRPFGTLMSRRTRRQVWLGIELARSDGSPSEGKASIAASGFSLSAWAVATQRGWTDRDTAFGA